MSVHVTSWVLKQSDARLADRLVLLVLADHANHDGTGAWASHKTIAHEARISERSVRYSLKRLEQSEAITRTGVSRHGTIVYAVVMSVNATSADIADPGKTRHLTCRILPTNHPLNHPSLSQESKDAGEGVITFDPSHLPRPWRTAA